MQVLAALELHVGREGSLAMHAVRLVLLLLLTVVLGGCAVVGDIFQAGFAVGVIAVVLVILGLVLLVKKLF